MPSFVFRLLANVHHRLWWLHAKTVGVRAVVIGPDGVFLVRHAYTPGWYLPGGGVDRGESAEAAAIRELHEEGGIRCTERPVLHGVYWNGGRDHVVCYVVRSFEPDEAARPAAWEIAESGFFQPNALPSGTTRATSARIAEVVSGHPVADRW